LNIPSVQFLRRKIKNAIVINIEGGDFTAGKVQLRGSPLQLDNDLPVKRNVQS
jgi:hypothetical protein